jgi:hypothetical protein
MAHTKSITTFLAAFLVVGLLFFSLSQDVRAGGPMPPIEPGCCQYGLEFGELSCFDSESGLCKIPEGASFDGFFEGESCNKDTGLCTGINKINEVPTLSEWGLIAMAGVLGIIGFMLVRRRKATA